MTDTTTGKPLRVLTSAIAPYLKLPYSQVDEVRHLLDAEGIYYDVSSSVISVNGGPQMAWINFGRKGIAEKIQSVLDQAR